MWGQDTGLFFSTGAGISSAVPDVAISAAPDHMSPVATRSGTYGRFITPRPRVSEAATPAVWLY